MQEFDKVKTASLSDELLHGISLCRAPIGKEFDKVRNAGPTVALLYGIFPLLSNKSDMGAVVVSDLGLSQYKLSIDQWCRTLSHLSHTPG